jgi:3-oxoadipate enol-lactonase
MPKTTVGDIDIYFERQGEGPRLLFISGTGGDLRNKPNIFDGPLARQFDLLAYDQRGLGQTSKPDAPYSMAGYADDAAGLMDALGWDDALVLGVSFGGMVAQELVLRHPGKVRRLVLACTSPGGAGGASFPFHEIDHMDRIERSKHLIPISDTRRDAAWAAGHAEFHEQLVALGAADPYADEPGHAMGARRQLEARARHDTWDRLPTIACPVMIAGGKYDGIALPQTQERLAARIPGATLRMFEGGHMFMIQDRAAVPAMAEFLLAGPP